MAKAVCGNATLTCSFGLAPSNLVANPSKVKIGGQPAATLQASAPNTNIPPFGMCTSLSNPAVAAALPVPPPGVLKPQPCTPMIPGTPWIGSSSKVKWSGAPALTTDGCLNCIYGGNIKISSAGQAKVSV